MSSASSGPDLARLHAEWEEVHAQLRDLEKSLSDSIALYARGQADRPSRLVVEVEHLRVVCSDKFQALMAAMKQAPGTGK
jgi:hypothetical protein